MARIDEIKNLFDRLCNTNLKIEDDIPEITHNQKIKLIKLIDDAKAEADRLHIIDIMNRVCR